MSELFFENLGGKLISCVRNHKTYSIMWSIISKYVVSWKYNREPNEERICMIKSFMLKGNYVPLYLHVGRILPNLIDLLCYDGNHRKEACNRLLNEHGIDNCVIIDVIDDTNDYEIHQEFKKLSKSIQVPSMYMEEPTDKSLRIIIDKKDIIDTYRKQYNKLISDSIRCNKPRFNIDLFTEDIDEIYTLCGSKDIVYEILSDMNMQYIKEYDGYVSDKITSLCRESNMWLFIKSRRIDMNDVIKTFKKLSMEYILK